MTGGHMEQMPLILDPCCGSRMMWFDRAHPDVVFGDRRREAITVTDRSHGREDGTRTLCIEPDALMDFRALPYRDETFYLVAFDPRTWCAPARDHGWPQSMESSAPTGARISARASPNASAYYGRMAPLSSNGMRHRSKCVRC